MKTPYTDLCKQQHEALNGLMKLIDDGDLVRNISKDSQSDWAVRQLPLIMSIKLTQQAIEQFNKIFK